MDPAVNIPNALTALRIVLIPAFAAGLIYGRYDIALYVFVAAALTDALDGLTARATKQKTRLGTVLDPLADKFMLMTSFILFSYFGFIPKWLTITVISRDIIVVSGWVMLFITHSLLLGPTMLGKLSIASEYLLLSYVLLTINFGILPGIKDALVTATAALAAMSGLQYILRGLKTASEK